jgi:hypothetical protein
MLDEVVIDIKMFNGSVDVLKGMGRCITEKTYYVKSSLILLKCRHAKHGGQGNMDGGIHIQQLFSEIWRTTVVKDTFML